MQRYTQERVKTFEKRKIANLERRNQGKLQESRDYDMAGTSKWDMAIQGEGIAEVKAGK
jgi:hypothetical protein